MSTLRGIELSATEQRNSRKFKRRKHLVKGTNYIWYIDRLDKLQRYGLPIHAAKFLMKSTVLKYVNTILTFSFKH